METGLRNRVAIVAASSKGIGRATALALAAEGTHLALCARNVDALDQVAEEARHQHGVEVYTETFDVAEDDRVRQFADAVHRRFGNIDICVTNAGGPGVMASDAWLELAVRPPNLFPKPPWPSGTALTS